MFNAKVFRVFIASPSDAAELRQIAEDVITDWNHLHAENSKAVLLPVLWEKDTAPGNDRAQDIINRTALDQSDLVVAIWRFLWGKGTNEEVERCVIDGSREVMQYFSVEPVSRNYEGNPARQALIDYQDRMTSAGAPYYWTYKSLEDFRTQFTRHLNMKIEELVKFYEFSQEDFTAEEKELLPHILNGIKIEYGYDKDGKFKIDVFNSMNFFNTLKEKDDADHENYLHAMESLFEKKILVNPAGESRMTENHIGKCFINANKRHEIEMVVRKLI